MPLLADASVDAVITDPPYPEIERSYGRWTEDEWFDLMQTTVLEIRRVLKPSGSAVFVLQPNSRVVGEMRLWLWRFMVWVGEHWNIVQDFYWWNFAAAPTVHCRRENGLARPSVRSLVWCGAADCYRNQKAVLWRPSKRMNAEDLSDRALQKRPSGQSIRAGRIAATVLERNGVTPFNLLPVANTASQSSSGAHQHGAGTPQELCRWWVRYICPPGGVVLDPFCGAGSVGVAAVQENRRFIGIEKERQYLKATAESIYQHQHKNEVSQKVNKGLWHRGKK